MNRDTRYHLPAIIEQMQKGDNSALRPIYVSHYESLLRYGCSIVSDKGMVHDEIQNLFVWILKHPHKLQTIQNLQIYLFKSLRRSLRAALKKQKESHIKAQLYQLDSLDVEESIDKEYASPSSDEKLIELRKQIKKLPHHQCEIVYLRFYENLTNDEIAEIFGVSNQVVRNTLCRALKNLRKYTTVLRSISAFMILLHIML